MKAALEWTKFCLRKDGKNYILPQKASPKDKKMQKTKTAQFTTCNFPSKLRKKTKNTQKNLKQEKTCKNPGKNDGVSLSL